MTQDQSGKLDLKMKVLVVDDSAARRKIMRNYLKKRGLGDIVLAADEILPQAIFWLRK